MFLPLPLTEEVGMKGMINLTGSLTLNTFPFQVFFFFFDVRILENTCLRGGTGIPAKKKTKKNQKTWKHLPCKT